MKVCNKCGQNKILSEYHKRGSGFQNCCKPCKSLYQKERRHKDPITFNARKQEHILKRRKVAQEYVLKHLLKNPCKTCNEADPIVLDFDHISDKEFNISEAVSHGLSLDKLQKEMDKCDILCANCHRRKTAKDFNWWKCPVS